MVTYTTFVNKYALVMSVEELISESKTMNLGLLQVNLINN